MALPGSGPLSLANVAIEFGDTAPYSMSEFYRGGGKVTTNNTNVPTSGAITFSNFYNAVKAFVFNQTISGTTLNYNLKSAAIAAGWDQVVPLIATVTINSGQIVGSSSTGAYAFDTGSTFPTGTLLSLINNGYIVGRAGDGGVGGGASSTKGGLTTSPPAAGTSGGPALIARYPISITNNNIIGGGGGGGGGGSYWAQSTSDYGGGGGGGGGAGYYSGSGGAFGGGNGPGVVLGRGGDGSLTAGGSGGLGYISLNGGSGGGLGSAGAKGTDGQVYGPSGGSGGAAVAGNSNITWNTTGTRYGSIS